MRQYLEIGPTPSGEDCEQVGPNYVRSKALKECQVYARQLHRQFPELDGNERVWLRTKTERHDFGSYVELAVSFDVDDEPGVDLAYRIESEAPEYWDDEARAELGLSVS